MSSLWTVSSDISPTYIISSVQLCNYVLHLSDGITPPSPAQKGNDQREALQTVDLKSWSDQPFFFIRKKKTCSWFERPTPKEGDETTEVTCKQAETKYNIAKFRNVVSELCRSLGTKGMSWCEANISVLVLLTLHRYTGVWTKIEPVCSDQIQKVKSDSDDAPCDDFFYPPLLTLCCPYRLNSELPHCLVLGSSASERAGAMCFDGDSTFGWFRKTAKPSHYCHSSPCCQGKVTGRWLQVWEVLWSDALRLTFQILFRDLTGASLFFNRRRFQPGGEIN